MLAVGCTAAFSIAAAQSSDTLSHAHDRTSANAAHSPDPGSKELHQTMTNGIQQMRAVNIVGNVDQDFTAMMIQHHQQAIAMSKAQLTHGTDEVVRKKGAANYREQRKGYRGAEAVAGAPECL